MKATFSLIHNDRQKTCSLLSSSEVNWTFVRVPFIEFTEARWGTTVALNDCKGNKINLAELASFVFEQLSDVSYVGKSPFMASA